MFVKHNLVAMPLATAIWLVERDSKEAGRFVLAGLAAGLAGLIGFRLLTGVNLLGQIFSPRIATFENFENSSFHFLSWAAVPLLITIWLALRLPQDRWVRFAVLYAGIAVIAGETFAAGDGVDANVFFDAAIALALSGGLALSRFAPRFSGFVAIAYIAPVALLLGLNFRDDNFFYKEAFRRLASSDISFLASRRGPALCEDLALCYWANKDATVDVFNMGEAFTIGAQDDSGLVKRLQTREFSALQFYSLAPFALGPKVHETILANYRVDHEDDNGVFLVRR
jgi:hypothetical protein